jgi:hypothetical protein
VASRGGKLTEQHIAAAIDADHVRVRHPDDVNALRRQPVSNRGSIWWLRHASSLRHDQSWPRNVWQQTIDMAA